MNQQSSLLQPQNTSITLNKPSHTINIGGPQATNTHKKITHLLNQQHSRKLNSHSQNGKLYRGSNFDVKTLGAFDKAKIVDLMVIIFFYIFRLTQKMEPIKYLAKKTSWPDLEIKFKTIFWRRDVLTCLLMNLMISHITLKNHNDLLFIHFIQYIVYSQINHFWVYILQNQFYMRLSLKF